MDNLTSGEIKRKIDEFPPMDRESIDYCIRQLNDMIKLHKGHAIFAIAFVGAQLSEGEHHAY